MIGFLKAFYGPIGYTALKNALMNCAPFRTKISGETLQKTLSLKNHIIDTIYFDTTFAQYVQCTMQLQSQGLV